MISSDKKPQPRRQYEVPSITVYGNIRDITRSTAGSSMAQDGGGQVLLGILLNGWWKSDG
jgi:hypothetical protein